MMMAAIAFRVPGGSECDAKNARFSNSAARNKYVKPMVRPGWK
jgi:hypothetical protein